MSLSRDQIRHIATLARLGLSEEDIDRFSSQLSVILDNFERLSQVDTEGVPPTAHTLAMHNVWREDHVQPSCDAVDVLANAPLRERDYFRVAAILEE